MPAATEINSFWYIKPKLLINNNAGIINKINSFKTLLVLSLFIREPYGNPYINIKQAIIIFSKEVKIKPNAKYCTGIKYPATKPIRTNQDNLKLNAITNRINIKDALSIHKKYFFPCFNSSFVYFAIKIPINIPIKLSNEYM